MRHSRLKAVIILLALSVTSPVLSQSQPFRFITARVFPKREYGVWVVSPIQESRIKQNGPITEVQFRLVGANDWKIFDASRIDRIEYELSAQPEPCVLPVPTRTIDKGPSAASGTWIGT